MIRYFSSHHLLGKVLFSVFLALAGALVWNSCLSWAQSSSSVEGAPQATHIPGESSLALTAAERQWLQEHPRIRVAQDPSWPPIEFADEKGNPSGISGDYLKILEARLGIKFEQVRNLSWQEAYASLQHWDIDMTTSVTVTPERKKFWAFTEPYMRIPLVILAHSDITYVGDMRQLEGKKVAVVDGYAICDLLARDYPAIELIKVKTTKEGIDRLQAREVFAFVDNMLVIGYYLAQLKIINLKIAGETPYVNAQAMAVRKDWAPLAGILQKALDSISEHQQREIYNRWVPIHYDHGFNYQQFWQISLLFLLVVLMLSFWIQRLTREIRLRKASEAGLRASEQKFRRLINIAPIPLCQVDKDGYLRALNQRFTQTFGFTQEDVPTLSEWWLNAYPEEGYRTFVQEKWKARMAGALAGNGDLEPTENLITRKDGVRLNVLVSGTMLDDGILYVFIDITQLRRAEEDKSKLEAQLRQAQKLEAVGTLAGGIAHDFNNLLGAIIGYAELAQDVAQSREDNSSELMEVLKASERAKELVRQILTFSRKVEVEMKPLDLNREVERAVALLERTLPKMIDIQTRLANNLRPVRANANQIEQILLNLGTNAHDAMPEGGNLIIETQEVALDQEYCAQHVEVSAGSYVLLQVSDTGQGMDQITREHIFEPFFTTKEVGRGTGLGLSTVYGIVKSHGGSITCYSEPGMGTTFKIFLPVIGEESSQFQGEEPVDLKTLGGNERILLVDDEQPLRELGQRILAQAGYQVDTVDSGEAALRRLREDGPSFALVIMDLSMPGMGGHQALKAISSLGLPAKVIIVSGYAATGQAQASLQSGAAGYVAKPYRKMDLLTTVRAVLDGK